MTISIETAEAMIRAAKATATERKLPPVNIAVVDASAHLVAFARMDGALLGAIDVSLKKARTAALFKTDSAVLGTIMLPGAPAYTLEGTNGGLIGFGGGVVVRDRAGAVIGAVGISGASVEEDELIANAASAAALV